MNDRSRFGKLMLAMSLALKMYGRELNELMTEVYWKALSDLTDAEFESAATILLRQETDFPPPALFLALARPRADLNAEAHRVMCQAMLLTEYNPEDGETWRASHIREQIGEAAYTAFLACGGAAGFRDADSPYHGARIRREFRDAYQQSVQADPSNALPSPVKSLPLPEPFQALIDAIAKPMLRLTDGLERPIETPRGTPSTPEEIETKRAAFKAAAHGIPV